MAKTKPVEFVTVEFVGDYRQADGRRSVHPGSFDFGPDNDEISGDYAPGDQRTVPKSQADMLVGSLPIWFRFVKPPKTADDQKPGKDASTQSDVKDETAKTHEKPAAPSGKE